MMMNGELLWRIILCELIILLAVLGVLLILLVWWLLRKLVVVPALAVATDKASYFREETVQISGLLQQNGSPLANQTVGLTVKPPTGDAYSLPPVTTDTEGKFTASWAIPSDAVGGQYAVEAASAGVKATATFTLK